MISHNDLITILYYCPWTGEWTWKINKGKNCCKGKKAGSLNSHGYVRIVINGEYYQANILAHFYMFEEWPKNEIDHRDNIKSNNRFFNLREATRSQNEANKLKRKDNTSGYKGVTEIKTIKKYISRIHKDKKRFYLGIFDCPIEAAKAYDEKAIELFGEFAKLNFPKEKQK